MTLKFTFGADPELFVKEKATGKFVCADGLIKGSKEDPFPVKNGAIQVDGMAVEFNIDPATTLKDFKGNIKAVRKQLEEAVGPEYELVALPSVEFEENVWVNAPEHAREMGCSADWNAYTLEQNPSPKDVGTLRAAGGHIHIGWEHSDGTEIEYMSKGHLEACAMVTKQLDRTLATEQHNWDDDERRLELYGALGSFRPKPYGVEYRTMSNAWLKSDKTIDFVFKTVRKSLTLLLTGGNYSFSTPRHVRSLTPPDRSYLGLPIWR